MRPVLFEPGSKYAYSNPGMAMLSYAITAALRGTEHTDVRTLLRQRIMRPIGVSDSDWSIGYGATYTVDDLNLVANWGGGGYTARAVARVGRLMLRKGNWQGRQSLSSPNGFRRWSSMRARLCPTDCRESAAGVGLRMVDQRRRGVAQGPARRLRGSGRETRCCSSCPAWT